LERKVGQKATHAQAHDSEVEEGEYVEADNDELPTEQIAPKRMKPAPEDVNSAANEIEDPKNAERSLTDKI